jgi:putative copper export protein
LNEQSRSNFNIVMLFSSTTAQAHAFLEHAIPAVVSTVLIKIALFLVMLGFGAVNRYWLTPRLLTTKGSPKEDTRALRLVCTSVSLEIALGLVVIFVVAALGQLPPPGHMHHAV